MDRLTAIRQICSNELTLASFTKALFAPNSPLLRLFNEETATIATDTAKAAKQLVEGNTPDKSPWFDLITRILDRRDALQRLTESQQALYSLLEALDLLATLGLVSDRTLRAELFLGNALHGFGCAGQGVATNSFLDYLLGWSVNDRIASTSA